MTFPRYCDYCGTKMREEIKAVLGYDEATGDPVFKYFYRCPNERFWNLHKKGWYF